MKSPPDELTVLSAADLLRPTEFDEYIGQVRLKQELHVRVSAARERGAALDHILLAGPAGMGKTSLVAIIGKMMGVPVNVHEMPFGPEDYRSMREEWGIMQLEEVHNLTTAQKVEMLSFLEHLAIHPKGRGMIEWEQLTIIGTTTNEGALSTPMRDRFPIQPTFDPYTDAEMQQITMGMAGRISPSVPLAPEDALVLASAAAGVPRKASHFVTAARDLFVVTRQIPTAAEVLKFTRHTTDGLSPSHVIYLNACYRNSPIGMSGLKAVINKDEAGVVALEGLLLKLDYIERTSRGRDLTGIGSRRIRELLNNPEN